MRHGMESAYMENKFLVTMHSFTKGPEGDETVGIR